MKINGVDDSLLAFICTSCPTGIKDHLFDLLQSCFGLMSAMTEQDTAALKAQFGDENPFKALHFSWYNRHTTQVCYVVHAS